MSFISPDALITKGDVILGGLFPIHMKSQTSENECGEFNELTGYQYMEAMMFAIDKINRDPQLLPSITLGAQIYDTCLSKTIAADRAKEFIKMSLEQDGTRGQLAGVVGALTSGVSLVVANFLRVFEIPQISYASTSETLSNKDIYSYFLRTVPPDTFQARAMVDIVKKFGWSYISTVNSYGEYGENGIRNVKELAEKEGICIDVDKQLSAFPTDDEYRNVIEALLKSASETNMSTVVLFVTLRDARKLLEAARMYDNAHTFTWIGNDGWTNLEHITEKAREAAIGLLGIEIQRGENIQEFMDYFTNLNLTNYPKEYNELVQFLELMLCISSRTHVIRHPNSLYHSNRYHILSHTLLPHHHTTPHDTTSYHTIPYHTIPYHTIPYHTTPHHSIPYHSIPYHTIAYHTIAYHSIA